MGGIFDVHNFFIPGPGKYDSHSSLSNIKFSLGVRFKDVMEHKNKNPGPGHYKNYETINKNGKYVISKYESSKASNFNPPNSKRFTESIIYNFIIKIIFKFI